jgi:phosphate-selective porin OprO/OprP
MSSRKLFLGTILCFLAQVASGQTEPFDAAGPQVSWPVSSASSARGPTPYVGTTTSPPPSGALPPVVRPADAKRATTEIQQQRQWTDITDPMDRSDQYRATPIADMRDSAEWGAVAATSESVAMPANVPAPADSLAAELAALTRRIEALEHPPLKYPANIKVSGVFQVDGVLFSQDAANKAPPALGGVGPIENGADFRRARLAASAALAPNMNAFFQMDFGFPGRPTFTDLWIDWTDLPVVGTIRVGQWKQPFSLEVVSSFRYTTFMERASTFQAFTPFRHIGIGAYNHQDDLMGTWAASYLRTGQDQFGGSLSTHGGNGFAGRVTRLVWYDESDGRNYLHLGGDYYLNVPPNHSIAFRSIPEIFVGQNANDGVGTAGFAVPGVFDGTPFFVNTGTLTRVGHVHTFDVELLWVYGPLSVQAEYMPAIVDRENAATAVLDGGYLQVGYFLTGEHRPYDRKAGAIDRVLPLEDFFLVRTDRGLERGTGAWELAARLSHIDLNDGTISGGVMNNLTLGVNWYCNPYCKVVFNYIHSWVQSPTSPPAAGNHPAVAVKSEANAFGLRAQMDF